MAREDVFMHDRSVEKRGWVSGLGQDPEDGLDQDATPHVPSSAPFHLPGAPVAGAATNLSDAASQEAQSPQEPSQQKHSHVALRYLTVLFSVAVLLATSGVVYLLLDTPSDTASQQHYEEEITASSSSPRALPEYTGGPEETEPPLSEQRPAELGEDHIQSEGGLYSYDVPRDSSARVDPGASGRAPEYHTSLTLQAGVVSVKRYMLGSTSSSDSLDLPTAAVQSVAYIGNVQEPRSVSVDGREAIILIVTNVFGNGGSAVFVFIVLDREQRSVIRMSGINVSDTSSGEYQQKDFESVHANVMSILLSFRIGVS